MGTSPPVNRRPIAQVFRKTAHLAVRFCVARRISADLISVSSIAASLAAGACIWLGGWLHWLLLIAPFFLMLRLWLNMLDGMVAIESGTASKRGEIANELPDRISDIIIFVSVAHSGLLYPLLGYWAAIMAIMTAYIGTLGQAVTGVRSYIGTMSKQYRMAWLALGLWATWIVGLTGMSFRVGFGSILDATMMTIIVGCAQTCLVRLRAIWHLAGKSNS